MSLRFIEGIDASLVLTLVVKDSVDDELLGV